MSADNILSTAIGPSPGEPLSPSSKWSQRRGILSAIALVTVVVAVGVGLIAARFHPPSWVVVLLWAVVVLFAWAGTAAILGLIFVTEARLRTGTWAVCATVELVLVLVLLFITEPNLVSATPPIAGETARGGAAALFLGPAVFAALITGIVGTLLKAHFDVQLQERRGEQQAELAELTTRLNEEADTRRRAKEVLTQLENWPNILAQELEKQRGTERQSRRYSSYYSLWLKLQLLHSYGSQPINRKTAAKISAAIRAWYFNDGGGLVASSWVRDMYLSLQRILQGVAEKRDGWQAKGTGDHKKLFEAFLEEHNLKGQRDFMRELETSASDAWPLPDLEIKTRRWAKEVPKICVAFWDGQDIGEEERYAILQQSASLLRTMLTRDLSTRVR